MRSNSVLFSFLSISGVVVAVACGNAPEPQVPASPSVPSAVSTAAANPVGAASSGVAAAAVPTVWSHAMPKEQQMAFMKTRIIPAMGPVFQAGNAAKYANFDCKTCHGPNYVEPKEFLPKLTMKGGNITSFAEKPEVSKFMAEKVVPAMANAMGMPAYNPQTHQGFGCGGCHAIEMK